MQKDRLEVGWRKVGCESYIIHTYLKAVAVILFHSGCGYLSGVLEINGLFREQKLDVMVSRSNFPNSGLLDSKQQLVFNTFK